MRYPYCLSCGGRVVLLPAPDGMYLAEPPKYHRCTGCGRFFDEFDVQYERGIGWWDDGRDPR